MALTRAQKCTGVLCWPPCNWRVAVQTGVNSHLSMCSDQLLDDAFLLTRQLSRFQPPEVLLDQVFPLNSCSDLLAVVLDPQFPCRLRMRQGLPLSCSLNGFSRIFSNIFWKDRTEDLGAT